MDFRTRIKELCEERGITQKELAEKLGITDISLNKTLRGNYPQLQTLEKIAGALAVPISDLFTKPREDEGVITCPYCGKTITLKAEKDERD